MSEEQQSIGPYRLVRVLGQGGMGIVYRAEHGETRQAVALKTVRVPAAGQAQALRREIHALTRLRHPGIVPVLAEGEHDGLPWYAMELVEGSTLRQWAEMQHTGASTAGVSAGHLTDRAAPVFGSDAEQPATQPVVDDEASGTALAASASVVSGADPAMLSLVRRLCEALAYLHGEGIVHRDLKPSNVFVRPDGTPVLVDFGLAASSGGEQGREALQFGAHLAGTIPYMPPEQLQGQLVDARADLYALGCVLYELLTGRPPFLSQNRMHVVYQHLNASPRPPSELAPGVPAELDGLVLRLLAKRPEDRPGHADDVAAWLGALGAQGGFAGLVPKARAYLYRPRFVGRGAALAELRRLLAAAVAGKSTLALVGGESGIGKTRLVLELGREAAGEKLLVLAGECLPDAAQPLQALRKPLEAIADRCRELGARETERLLGVRGKVLAAYEPALAALPGQEAYDEPAQLPPAQALLRLQVYLAETLSALCSGGPVLLVLDDLQWADGLTLRFLGFLLQFWSSGDQGRAPLLVVGTFRTEEIGPDLQELLQTPGAVRLELDRLDEPAVAELVGDMLALLPPPRLFSRFLARQSEGNPFFVGEYLRTAVAEGLLWRDGLGYWQVGAEQDEEAEAGAEAQYERLPLPGSLRLLVGRRLQGLSEPARRLVQAAAVLGREAPSAVAWRLARLSRTEVLEATDEALRRHVLEEPDPSRLRFVHDKLREVAYEGLSGEERARLHRAAAEGIETLLAPEREQHLAELGHHWEQAAEPERARHYYLAAARRATSESALQDAEALYRAYLRLALEPTVESVLVCKELCMKVLRIRGQMRQALAELEAVLEPARKLGDLALEGKILADLGVLRGHTGQSDEAQALLVRALEIARGLDDRSFEGRVLFSMASLAIDQAQLKQAHPLYEQALAIARALGDRQYEGPALEGLAMVHHRQGRTEQARSLYEQAISMARESGDRVWEGCGLGNLAILEFEQGQVEQARQLWEQSIVILRKAGDRRTEAMMLGNLGVLHRQQGRLEQARQMFEQARAVHRQIGERRGEANWLLNLAHLWNDRDRPEQAQQLYEEALASFRQLGNRTRVGNTLGSLSRVYYRQGRVEQALHSVQEAIAIAREEGDRDGEADALCLDAGFEREALGRFAEARQKLLRAESVFRDTGSKQSLAHCLCEQGHLALAEGRSPERCLQEAERLARELAVLPESALGRAVARLRLAQAAFEAGEQQRLFRGRLIEDLPEGLRRRLVQDGQLPAGSA